MRRYMKDLNVLIVEDEIVIYMHIMKTLQKLGFQNIKIVKSAKEAFEIMEKLHIDLVFSDIKIDGDTDGIELSKTLQKLYNTPIIFITAYKDEETLIRASEVDFVGYLLKPYRHDELEALIKIAISKYRLKSTNDFIYLNDYQYNKDTKELYYQEKSIHLTKKETLFIALMFTNLDILIDYETLDKSVWFEEYVSDNTRRTFIYRLKQKLPSLNLQIEKNLGIGLFSH